jgi:uncharacterized SAM-binding protein YcdF (DUF218 family)
MSLGLGIFLFVVGAILVWALNFSLDWINLDLVGYIFMGAGVVIIILGLVLMMRKRSSVSETRSVVDPASGQQVTRRENTIDDI